MLWRAHSLQIGRCSLHELSALNPCWPRKLCRLEFLKSHQFVILTLTESAVCPCHLELPLIDGPFLNLPLLLLLLFLPHLPIGQVAIFGPVFSIILFFNLLLRTQVLLCLLLDRINLLESLVECVVIAGGVLHHRVYRSVSSIREPFTWLPLVVVGEFFKLPHEHTIFITFPLDNLVYFLLQAVIFLIHSALDLSLQCRVLLGGLFHLLESL